MSTVGEIILEVGVDTSDATRDIENSMDKAGKSSSGKFKGGFIGGLKGLAGPIAALAGAAAVGEFFTGSIDEAREAQKVGAQTTASLKATGGAAGVTAEQIGKLAGALSAKTGIDDEAIQSGQNLLLNFKNIKNGAGENEKIFDRATTNMVDYAAAMGVDSTNAAKLLGKALNDPEKGLTALKKAGVVFTAEQQAQVKAMQANGDMAGAQSILLGELEARFKGSAEAQATAGDKAAVAWGNLQETVGTMLLPVLDVLMTKMTGLFLWISANLGPALELLGSTIMPPLRAAFDSIVGAVDGMGLSFSGNSGKVSEFVSTMQTYLEPLLPKVQAIFEGIKSTIGPAMELVGLIITRVVQGIQLIWNNFGVQIATVVQKYFGLVLTVIQTVIQSIRNIISIFIAVFKGDWDGAWEAVKKTVFDAFEGVKNILKAAWELIKSIFALQLEILKTAWGAAWEGIKNLVSNVWDRIKEAVANKFEDMKNGVMNKLSAIREFWANVWEAIKTKVAGVWDSIKESVSNKFEDVKNGISNKLASIKEFWGNAWDGLKTAVGTAFVNVKTTMEEKFTDVVNKVKELPGKILAAFGSPGETLKQTGKDIIQGLVDGLESAKQWVIDKISEIADVVPDWVKKKLGIKSPSRVMKEIGVWTVQGMVEGLDSQQGNLKKSLAAVNDMVAGATASLNVNGSAPATAAQIAASRPAPNITIQNPVGQTAEEAVRQAFEAAALHDALQSF